MSVRWPFLFITLPAKDRPSNQFKYVFLHFSMSCTFCAYDIVVCSLVDGCKNCLQDALKEVQRVLLADFEHIKAMSSESSNRAQHINAAASNLILVRH